jgi:hypothetical protein
MQRLTARLLLLFALLGNFVPVALAGVAPPTAKCCLRKAVHHCHSGSIPAHDEDELSIRAASCCSHDCCGAATPAHWAQPEAKNRAIIGRSLENLLAAPQLKSFSVTAPASLSTRAPPQCAIL